ncbi:MAG TPA: aldehyde dehydrogenase family protein, partial [Solirubrobacteraceae bacterium]|nr:aldehyde dehydrogenase family protein [Solirubrobacteraceae bacterium]
MTTQTTSERKLRLQAALDAFGIGEEVSGVSIGGRFVDLPGGPVIETIDPTTGSVLARVRSASAADTAAAVRASHDVFLRWRLLPAPRRGDYVRQMGDAFRARKEDLAQLISIENGKILGEARGEVQEVIDMCDLAVGLSRQLYGRDIASERPDHRLIERWHPLGVVGIISAFNFPVAVPGWGWALSLVCGDTVVWKPSSLTPLISIAVQKIFDEVT